MKFTVNNEEYELDKSKFTGLLNDEENPIEDITEDDILSILEKFVPDFEKAYYSAPCEECNNKEDKKKAYLFYEYHFYLYTKDNKVVANSIDLENENNSFTRMKSVGKADNSYIVSIIVCSDCGSFDIEIEEFEV